MNDREKQPIVVDIEENSIRERVKEQMKLVPKGAILAEDGKKTVMDQLNEMFGGINNRKVEIVKPFPDALINAKFPRWGEKVDKLLEEYPDLCWVRGTEAKTVTDDFYLADGFVGDLRVLDFAFRGYNGEREQPAVVLIPLKKVIEAYREGILSIGSHHGYDVSISRGSGFEEWLADNLIVVELTGLAEKEVSSLFREKQIKVISAV